MRPRSSFARRVPARRIPARAALIAATLALILGGCDLMVATTTPRPSRLVATPEPVPTAGPTENDQVPTLRPDPSGSGPDLLDAANALADLRSYRVAVATRGLVAATPAGGLVTMTSTLVQSADPAAEFSMADVDGFTGGRLQAVVIGDRAWLKEGGGSWVASPGGAADFDAAFTTLSPIDLVTQFDALSAALVKVGSERHDGRPTIRYHADSGDAVANAAGLTAGSVDLWVSTSGRFLVGLTLDGTWNGTGAPVAVTLKIDVTRVNDAANKVAPPL
jgi:hypothetical protein